MCELEKRLASAIVGQEDAIKAVVSTVKRREVGFSDVNSPLVLLFLGSSGVGKTEMAKEIARYVHQDVSKGFIRLDMSEYHDRHMISKFIGSPPGYVGHDDGGQLTEGLRKCPNAVVLLDEVEKAHPEVLNVMLPLFDEGRLTDGKGSTVECKEAIFIMTSNLGSDVIMDYVKQLRSTSANVQLSDEFKEEKIIPILKGHFRRDEFLGRISEMVYFLPFSYKELHILVTKELESLAKIAKEKHKIEFSWQSQVIEALSEYFNVRTGARSIKNAVEQNISNKLANAYLNKSYKAGDHVQVTVEVSGADNVKQFSLKKLIITMASNCSKETSHRDLNILLLGRTGVGKSTFINAFANYVNYEEMEDVEELEYPVPASFVLCDSFDQIHYLDVGVEKNKDNNESLEYNKSGTRGCKTYEFKMNYLNINLIDTPGIGDTEGVSRDSENMEKVLDFLAHYQAIHAICILMKPDEVRLDAIFKYCILELLSKLEKSACNNIVFVFTNSRSTYYRPGHSSLAIQEILDRIKNSHPDVNIKFNKDTYYCLDSESFKFLVALRNGMEFDDDEKEMYAQSWRKSRKDILRMIEYIQTLPPHLVLNTISVNDARRIIIALSQPLADIAKNISQNITRCKEHENEIKECENDIQLLKKQLYIPRTDLTLDHFDKPRTVCASNKCKKIIVVDGEQKIHYQQICHSPCTLVETPKNIKGDPNLKRCACFYTPNTSNYEEDCYRCGCNYLHHMHIYYDTKEVDVKIEDVNTKRRIKNKSEIKNEVQKIQARLKSDIQKYEQEKCIITNATSKFACFLKSEAITTYNDAFEEYLEILIKNEKTLAFQNQKSKEKIAHLENWMKEYKEKKKVLDNAMNKSGSEKIVITANDIITLADNLCKLEFSGKNIAEALQKQTELRRDEKFEERRVVCKIKEKNKGLFFWLH